MADGVPQAGSARLSLLQNDGLARVLRPEFEDIVRMAAKACGTAMASLSVVENGRERFVACHGCAAGELETAGSFAKHIVDSDAPLVVEDVPVDTRFRNAPLVDAIAGLRCYAGVPIEGDGVATGVLAVMDTVRREIGPDELDTLNALARHVVVRLDLERKATSAPDGVDFAAVFNALPGLFWVMEPDTYRLVAASDALVHSAGTTREKIIGKTLFEAFPGDSANPESAESMRALRASIERVKMTRDGDEMIALRYPVPGSEGGEPEDRYWSVFNTPLCDASGKVKYIIHRSEDITGIIRRREDKGDTRRFDKRADQMAADIAHRTRELKRLNDHLRFAQRVASIGSWEYNIEDGSRTWSDEVYHILGIERGQAPEGEKTIASVVHPDDLKLLADARERALNGELTEFEHRIVRSDGTRYVRERAQLMKDDNGNPMLLFGTIQDVTEHKWAQERLRQSENLMHIAGQIAKLGAWQLDVQNQCITWSDEVAAIHDLPPRSSVGYEEAMGFIAPEWREDVRRALEACIEEGMPYDMEFEIVTARESRSWVRGIGKPVRGRDGTVQYVQGALQDITQKKQAEAAIEELASQLTATLESISDGFATLDRGWRVTFMNKQAENILQRSREELLGKFLWDEYEDAVGTTFEREYRRAVTENVTVSFEEYYPPLGVWLDVTVYPSSEGLAVYFRDVSERKQTEAAKHESEERIRAIIDNALDAVVAISADSTVTTWNHQAERTFGWAEEEAVGSKLYDLIIPERFRDDHCRGLERFLATGEGVLLNRRTEVPALHRDGHEFPVELTISSVKTEDGYSFSAFVRDITERKEYEKQLRQQADLLDKAPDAIIVRDVRNRITYWNKGAERLYGWTAAEAVGRDMEELLKPTPERFHDGLKQVFETGEWSGEIIKHRKDGTTINVGGAWTLVKSKEGKPESVLTIDTDITERLALEEQLRQSQRLESVGQLTGGVAHDFNNLLTVILGNAELLADRLTDSPRLLRLAEMSRAAAQRGAELTHRLLAFARRQALEPRMIDTNQLVLGMEDLLRRTLLENIDIEIIPAENAWWAYVDPAQLESVLLNLVINAKDAMPGGGLLTVETANVRLDEEYAASNAEVTPGQYVMIAVSDTGCGIEPENVSRVFDPFFTTKEKGKGTGLGLSMAYGFAKQSEGHIKIYSEPGQGTTVKLYLPRSERPGETVEVAPVSVKDMTGTEKVLVVEDDDLVRQHAESQLKELGYDVLVARNGPEAMEIIKDENDIDLLFTDVIMSGGMTGRDLAETAKRLRPKLKVLYTSGYTENAIVHHGRLDQGVQLLQKPYQRADLAKKLRGVLNGSSPGGSNNGRPGTDTR